MKDEKTLRRSWVRILFGFVIILVLLWLFDFELILEAIGSADWLMLGATAVVLLLGYAVEAVRLRYLFSHLPPYRFTYHVKDVSNMMNLVTLIPVTIFRIFLMSQDESVTAARAMSSSSLAIIFDWILKIVAILGVILIFVRSRYLEDFLLLFLLILAGLIGGILFLVGNADKIVVKMAPRLSRLPFLSDEQSTIILIELAQGLQAIGSRRRLLGALGWTALTWTIGLLFYALGMLALNINIPPQRLLASAMLVTVFVNPYSPYLPGIYQVLLLIPLILVSGAAPHKLAALSIVLYALLLLIWFSLGLIGLRSLDLNFKGLRQQVSQYMQEMRQNDVSEPQRVQP